MDKIIGGQYDPLLGLVSIFAVILPICTLFRHLVNLVGDIVEVHVVI